MEVLVVVTPQELRDIADHLEANPNDLCHLSATDGFGKAEFDVTFSTEVR